MNKYQNAFLSIGLLFFISLSGISLAADAINRDQLDQISTLTVLMEGLYAGEVTQVDGLFYQMKADGKVYQVNDKEKVPFAVVTFFENDRSFVISKPMKLAELVAEIDKAISSRHIWYTVRIEGIFSYEQTWSASAPEKPYRILKEVVKDQPTFERRVILGTMVGFRCPAYVSGINLPDYHLHFIDNRNVVPGDLMDAEITAGTVELGCTNGFCLDLPY